MLAAQRRDVILWHLDRDGAVTVAGLARLLDVSEMTVRRDLEALEREGRLQKVHGGATSGAGRGIEPGFAAKSVLQHDAKLAIARAAAAMVQPGSAVGLTSGSTTFCIAQQLRSMRGITVVTNAIRVAEVFADAAVDDIQVIVTGGTRTPSDALVGPIAIASMRALNLDICFMGVHGMDEQAGFTSPNMLEAEANRAMAATARQLVVVADSTKWGEVGLSRIAPLSEASTVITDASMPVDARNSLQTHVDRVVFAEILEETDATHGKTSE